jgi:hypothetical protein
MDGRNTLRVGRMNVFLAIGLTSGKGGNHRNSRIGIYADRPLVVL